MSLATDLKSAPYRLMGYGTGPKSIAISEIYGDNYTVSLFRDGSILGTHSDGSYIAIHDPAQPHDALQCSANSLRTKGTRIIKSII